MFLFRLIRWIFGSLLRASMLLGLMFWVLLLPLILAFMLVTFQAALDNAYFENDLDLALDPANGGDVTTAVILILFMIFVVLLGPFSMMRLIKDQNMPRWLHHIVRFLAHPSKWVIRLYAFVAGVAAVTSVGLVFFFPDQERLNALTLIYATMFTVFAGYARGIDRALAESTIDDDVSFF